MEESYSCWHQWIAICPLFCLAFVWGCHAGWIVPALPLVLYGIDSPVTEVEVSWLASIVNIGRAVGSIIGAIDVELFGTKTTVLHLAIVYGVSLVCLAVANSYTLVLVSRFIAGTGAGIFFLAFPLYIGEICDRGIRGGLISTVTIGVSLGYVVGIQIAGCFSILTFALTLLIIVGLFFITFVRIPKSPHYLVMTNRREEAIAAIKWYEKDADVQHELASLQSFVKDKSSMTYMHLLKEFMAPHNRIALVKLIILYGLLRFSGTFTLGSYLEIILKKGKVEMLFPLDTGVIISSIGIVGGWCAVYATDSFGRKTVLTASVTGLALSMMGIAVHFHFLEMGYDPHSLQWVIIINLIIFQWFMNFGIVTVPSIIMSEIFGPYVKTYSCCIAQITWGLTGFVTTYTFQRMIQVLGYNAYYIYAFLLGLTAIFIITQMPETKGKSLQEIQNMLLKKRDTETTIDDKLPEKVRELYNPPEICQQSRVQEKVCHI